MGALSSLRGAFFDDGQDALAGHAAVPSTAPLPSSTLLQQQVHLHIVSALQPSCDRRVHSIPFNILVFVSRSMLAPFCWMNLCLLDLPPFTHPVWLMEKLDFELSLIPGDRSQFGEHLSSHRRHRLGIVGASCRLQLLVDGAEIPE